MSVRAWRSCLALALLGAAVLVGLALAADAVWHQMVVPWLAWPGGPWPQHWKGGVP